MLEIDIDKHNIIEASAGTGKTHTIQNLVIQILSEKDIDLREILIVTYTEKATGELKDRIRGELENRIKNKNDAIFLEKLKSALKNFENCSIHTIHGFCNKIIKEYSFETGLSFNNEIVDDSEIYKKSLKKVMREKWRKKYGASLTDLLLFSKYPDVDARLRTSSFEKNVINIAINFNPQKETLLPDENLDIVKETLNLKKDIGERLETLKKIIGYIDDYEFKKSDFYAKYDNICQNKQKKGRFENIIIPLLEILVEKENQINGYFDFIRDLEKWSTFADNGYFNSLIFYGGKTRGKKEENLAGNFPELEEIINILENLRIDYGTEKRSKIKSLFLKETILDLKEQATKDKRENSQLSFSDMLYLLNEGLNNPELLSKLQSRYKYAIVDEFQDTDPIQYEIFTKIFLKSKKNRLFIIGDPKQSIYGFRGADVYTYFKAKNDLLKNNEPLELNYNYRSSKEIIGGFNVIFGGKWFSGSEIEYKNVLYPNREEKENPFISLKKEEAGVTIITNEDNGKKAKENSARFIANEIKRLLSENIYYVRKGKRKSLDYSDFAILVDIKCDATIIEKELDKLGIKHSFYKKPGLYQSAEAKNLFFLLKSLSSELSNGSILEALITDFFGLEIDRIVDKESLIANYYDLFLKWDEYAQKKEYNKLFQSIINDTGIFFRLIERNDGERSLTNYKHILQNLLFEAEKNNLSINQIVNLLKNYIEKYVAVEESEELHRQETEEKKVKILTIHASKGLEFPIVFIFAGFTTQKKEGNLDYYKFHRDERIFYDLSKDKSNLAENNIYEEFEKKRLYYVAITRSIFKLYIPLIKKNDDFLTNSLSDLNNPSIEYVDANSYDLIEKNITSEEMKESDDEKEYSIPENLFYFPDRNIKKRKDSLLSFSGLKKEIDNYKKFGEISLKDDENDEVEPLKNDLPPGILTGNMFHKILESIDYSIFKNFTSYKEIKKDDETEKIITACIEEYLFEYTKKDSEKFEIFKEVVYKRLFNVLNEPLNKEGFKLNLLENKERLNEVEFYYPLPKSNNLTVEKLAYKNGFLFGFIDMIFRIKEKYYILDWKSNSYDNYSGDSFYQKVKTEYNLQYKLYSIALLKFLKNNLKDFDYDKNFGGVYYVYIRGKTSSCDEGVFFERESIDPQIKYEEELLQLIGF